MSEPNKRSGRFIKSRSLEEKTEEDRKRKERFEVWKAQLTKDYIIGELLGAKLWKKMPNLSTTYFYNTWEVQPKTYSDPKIIRVSDEDYNEYNRLNKEYLSYTEHGENYDPLLGRDQAKESWFAYREFSEKIEEKYLPNPWVYESDILIDETFDHEEVKKGILSYLWDTDFCEYACTSETIKFEVNLNDYWCPQTKIYFYWEKSKIVW